MLCSAQVKTMRTTVASNHLRKLARMSVLELADGVSSAEGRQSDLVIGWSLRLKAARGPCATVEARDHVGMLASAASNLRRRGRRPPGCRAKAFRSAVFPNN